MGTYELGKKELIEVLTDCLDNIEGDFDSKDLYEALDFMKSYFPTSDSTKAQERSWRRKLKKLFDRE